VTRPLFLHAGLPKTATSALQRLVLARHPQIAYTALARKGGRHRGTSPFGGLVRAVRTGEPLFHDTCELRAVLEAALARDGRPDAVCAVVSEERFTGHYGAGLAAKADLAAVLAPRASVLLVVREPGELMVSQYFQLLRRDRYGLDGPRSFDAWARAALGQVGHHLSAANLLAYDRLVERGREPRAATRPPLRRALARGPGRDPRARRAGLRATGGDVRVGPGALGLPRHLTAVRDPVRRRARSRARRATVGAGSGGTGAGEGAC